LIVDRIATPLAPDVVERALLDGAAFGSAPARPLPNRVPIITGRSARAGIARPAETESRLLYTVVGAGAETLVARAILSADDLAFNLGVLAEAVASIEFAPLLSRPLAAPMGRGLSRVAEDGMPVAVVPAGTIVEAGNAPPCRGLDVARALVASPEGDFTVQFVASWWPAAALPSVRAACAAEGTGSRGFVSFGARYNVESRFIETAGGTLRVQLWAPERKAGFAADAFNAWTEALEAGAAAR
jgi:hypothetical protein